MSGQRYFRLGEFKEYHKGFPERLSLEKDKAPPDDSSDNSGGIALNRLESATEEYIAAILSSEEYVTYRQELEKVKQYPELKAQIDDFRKRNFEFQQSTDSNFSKLDSFEREYETFRENPMVSDFLAAELAFCRLMQRLNTRITAELRFE